VILLLGTGNAVEVGSSFNMPTSKFFREVFVSFRYFDFADSAVVSSSFSVAREVRFSHSFNERHFRGFFLGSGIHLD
jgi:hypothetical protein